KVLQTDIGNPNSSLSKITSDSLEALGDVALLTGAAVKFGGPELKPLELALDAFGNVLTLGTVAYNNRDAISGVASNLFSQVETQATQYVNTLKNTFNNAVVGAGNAIDSALHSVESGVSGALNSLSDALNSTSNSAYIEDMNSASNDLQNM